MKNKILRRNMTQGDKQLLLKDLCARLPHGVMCHADEINLDGELLFINKVYNIVALYNDKAAGKFNTCAIADVKPYLRPMSSMTEEEKKEYRKTECLSMLDLHHYPSLESYDWLNEYHFDYRGLIEKGLALEAPEGMYEEVIGVKESPSETFPRINEFDTGSSYRG